MIEVGSPVEHSVRRGRKAVVVATAAALIAGTGGFLVGRSTDDRGSGVGAVPVTTTATTAAPPATDATADTSAALGVADEAFGSGTVPLPAPPLGAAGTSSSSGGFVGGAPGGMYSPNAYEEPQMQLLAERTTPSGVVLRAHLSRYPGGTYTFGGPPGWAPAGWCFPQGNLRISIVAPNSVNVTNASWYTELKNGLSISTFASGYVEGSPIFGAVAQVDPGVATVTMTTASGLTDTTAVVGGIALLEVDGRIEQDVTFTLTNDDGSTTTRSVADLTQPYTSSQFHSDCDPPPPALPAAGEGPSDPAAAEAAVRANWAVVHDFTGDPQARSSLLDDTTGVADAWAALQQGQYADAAAAATADIAELVFTSPTEAWFRYDLLTPIANYYDRYGMATLRDDGVWVITRQTVCQDIQLAPGFGCSPTVDTLLPPSAASDPRYNPQPVDATGIVPG